jgi:hypothetical protein
MEVAQAYLPPTGSALTRYPLLIGLPAVECYAMHAPGVLNHVAQRKVNTQVAEIQQKHRVQNA